MARKRRLADPLLGERLFGDRLKQMLGEQPARTAPALAALLRERRARPATMTAEVVFHAHTVYLSEQDLLNVAFIVDAWGTAKRRRVTRSEVIRQAIRDLRATLGAQERASSSP